jgi:predicted nucleic acid-binding protein
MIFLDTDACIEILRGRASLEQLIRNYSDERFGISSPSLFELNVGIYNLKYLKKKYLAEKVREITERFGRTSPKIRCI